LAEYHILHEEFDFAMDEVDKAFSLNPAEEMNYQIKGDIYLFRNELDRAEEE